MAFASLFFFQHQKAGGKKQEVIKNDTDFILRKFDKDYYHAIFIERNRNSKYYKDLTDFTMNKYDTDDYLSNCDYLKKRFHSPLNKYDLNNFPKEWMPLYRYKGKYYIYYPSEWGLKDRTIFTDSTLVYWNMEGPYPNPIKLFKKINNNTWQIKARTLFPNDRQDFHYIIHMIDTVNQIAIWENENEKGPYRFDFYIPKEKAKNFDLIVNYCLQGKFNEFGFDVIDFEALLKRN